jgi:hypothetical protein
MRALFKSELTLVAGGIASDGEGCPGGDLTTPPDPTTVITYPETSATTSDTDPWAGRA